MATDTLGRHIGRSVRLHDTYRLDTFNDAGWLSYDTAVHDEYPSLAEAGAPDVDELLLSVVRPFLTRLPALDRAALDLIVMRGLGPREAAKVYAAELLLQDADRSAALAALLGIPTAALDRDDVLEAAHTASFAGKDDELQRILQVPHHKRLTRRADVALAKLRDTLAQTGWVRALASQHYGTLPATDQQSVPAAVAGGLLAGLLSLGAGEAA